MYYKEHAEKSKCAVQKGIRCILENHLPSYWNEDGFGWHEQWMEAEYSGINASCEGLILLSREREYVPPGEYKKIVEAVYERHLCSIFDENVDVDCKETLTMNRSCQRESASFVAYKMAEFIWASSYMENRNTELENTVAGKLYDLYDCQENLFKSTRDTKKGSIFTTAFVYAALIQSGHGQTELCRVEEYLKKYLFEAAKITESNYKQVILTMWALTFNTAGLDTETLNKCTKLFKELIDEFDLTKNLNAGERYIIKSNGVNDCFQLNLKLILIQIAEAYIKAGIIQFGHIKNIIEEIIHITAAILENGAYSADGRKSSVLFWENYYAIQILCSFCEIIKICDPKEDEFMIISPKIFRNKEYITDENLCVVIMPFKEEWSSEMYETFKEAAEGFRVWRSYSDYTDDVIIQTLWDNINRARFVIADCTGRNANVFYELGIAHTIGKQVFMCAQSREDFPFDVTHIRNFQYGLRPGEIRALKTSIKNFINSMQ